MNTVDFVLRLKDMLSAPLNAAASAGVQAYNRVAAAADNCRRSNDRLPSSIQQINQRLDELQRTREISISRRQIREIDREMDVLEARLLRMQRGGNAGGGMGSLIMGGVAAVAFTGAMALGGSIANFGMQQEQTKMGFEVMLGSAEKADQMMGNLRNMAAATPFASSDLAKSTETLLGFGIEAEKVLPIMSRLGDVSRGNTDRFNSLTLAYAQVQAAGKLQGQDMIQFINAGFNPLQEISKQTGISMAVLKEQMSEGGISAKMIELAFQSATAQGGQFFQMMQKQSETTGGRFSTLKDNVQTLGLSIYHHLQPGLNALMDLANFMMENKTVVLGLVTALGAYQLIANLAAIKTAILTGAQWLLNAAMTANPIGLVVAAIVLLVTWVVYAWKKVEWFRGGIYGIIESAKALGSVIKEFIVDRIKGFLSGIAGLGKSIMLFFKGEFSESFKTAKQAALDITGVSAVKNAIENGKKIGSAWKTGYNKGAAEVAANNKQATEAGAPADTAAPTSGDWSAAMNAAGTNGKTKGSSALSGSADGVAGNAARNVNITIGKFFDNFNLNTQTVNEGLDQLEAKVVEVMLRVMNSANSTN